MASSPVNNVMAASAIIEQRRLIPARTTRRKHHRPLPVAPQAITSSAVNPGEYSTDPRQERLASRLVSGDASVVAEIYHHYGNAVYAAILRTVRDRDTADDVQQQVFTEVWQRAANFDSSRGGLLTWILMIARSRAIDQVRRRVPEPTESDRMDRLVGQSENGSYGLESDRVIDRWQVTSLLLTLPERERQLLQLRFYEGLSQSEISERTGMPLGTVKAQMVRALRALRDELSEDEEAVRA